MDTLLDILTGIGLATAAGIRPFLPALAAGALASANATIDFDKTDLAFLEAPGWLLAVVVALILVVLIQRRGENSTVASIVSGLAVGIGAVLFAGALADHSETWWPGLVGGIVCAVLAERATRDLFARVRGRLDAEAQSALPVYAEGASLLLAILAILIPPVSLVALGFVVWLLLGGRRREGEKYAGLRILR
jgi:uncharacterized membrane protein YgdD (TMEM256/DUF423 family)